MGSRGGCDALISICSGGTGVITPPMHMSEGSNGDTRTRLSDPRCVTDNHVGEKVLTAWRSGCPSTTLCVSSTYRGWMLGLNFFSFAILSSGKLGPKGSEAEPAVLSLILALADRRWSVLHDLPCSIEEQKRRAELPCAHNAR